MRRTSSAGASEKLEGTDPDRYGFTQHRRFGDELLRRLDVTSEVVFVGHDWGGALAMDWTRRHPDAMRGIVYSETLARPKIVGERVVDAIRTKTFYAFVSAVPADVIRARHRRVEEALTSKWVAHY